MQKTAVSLFVIFKIVCSCAKRHGKQYWKNHCCNDNGLHAGLIFRTRSDVQHMLSCAVYMRRILIIGPAVKYYQLELVYESHHLRVPTLLVYRIVHTIEAKSIHQEIMPHVMSLANLLTS